MRKVGLLVPSLALLAATPALPAGPDCEVLVARALPACIRRATSALGACTVRRRALCTAAPGARRAAAALARKVRARCDDTSGLVAGVPGLGAAAAGDRFAAACLGESLALVGRSVDVLGGAEARACASGLTGASLRLATGGFAVRERCAARGEACDRAAVARRLDTLVARGRRAAFRACRHAGVGEAAVGGLLARVRAQGDCLLAQVHHDVPPCAPADATALVDLFGLAAARPPGTLAGQVSSYDRTGGNLDLGVGPDTAPLLANFGLPPFELPFSYLDRDGDRFVVFDETGPGVVWRIWMTGLDSLFAGGLGGDIAFELDDEPAPRLTLARGELFEGAAAPFLAPLAGDQFRSSGGFYSVLPIPFARRLRITTSTAPNWLQISFTRLPPDQAVASFDPTAGAAPIAAALDRAGDPQTTLAPEATDEVAVTVAPGTTAPLWTRPGSGTIVRLELFGPPGADVPLGLRLRAVFDGAPAPQVDAPLDDLFGASLGPGARALAFGRDGDRFYCHFPMPFADGARLEMQNDGPAAVQGWTLRVGTVGRVPAGVPTRFHARAAAVRAEPDGRDVALLETAGAGHVVGVVLTAGCGASGACRLPTLPGIDGTHLEGDERIAIDASRWPAWHGTGLEDLFGGGFYFVQGPFTLPTHGNPAQAPVASPRRPGLNLRSAYRSFFGEAIPFRSSIAFTIEHGPVNDVPVEMSSLVFYYLEAAPALVETDRLAIGDAASESAHALQVEGRSDLVFVSRFRGEPGDEPHTATGMAAARTVMRLAVAASNRGVRLRRVADLDGGRQRARVAVNGAFAGTWQTSEVNPWLRFAELDFELPAALTAGHDRLEIEIDARDSPSPWTAFEYAALSHTPGATSAAPALPRLHDARVEGRRRGR